MIRKIKTLLNLLRSLERIPHIEQDLLELKSLNKNMLVHPSVESIERATSAIRSDQDAFRRSFNVMIDDFRREIFYFSESNSQKNLTGSYSVRTNFPVAIDSDDHIFPCGTMQDNTRHPRFVRAVDNLFGRKIRTLDLGCSGGGLVLDFLLAGHDSMGIEGSDYSQRWVRAEWGTIPSRLFTADITKPFDIFDQDLPVKFDLITAWELLEHIPEKELPFLFDNIRRHIAPGGLFVGSVATFPHSDPVSGAIWHVTVKAKNWWHGIAREHGFEVVEGLFEIEDFPRGSGNPRRSDWSAKQDPSLGFHLCLRLSAKP